MIPKIIHHVWPGNDLFKEKFHFFRNTWVQKHPDWTFHFWRIDNFPKEADPNIIEAINDSGYSITPKSDFMRFEVIRLFGGIYVDTDMECLKPFDNFLNHDFFSAYQDHGNIVCPSLFGAIPGHPLIEKTCKIIIDSAKRVGYHYSNNNPDIYTSVIPFSDLLKNESNNYNNIKIYPKEYFYNIGYNERDRLNETCPESYAKHYWNGKEPDGWTNMVIKL